MASNIVKYILQLADKGASKALKSVSKASEKTSKNLDTITKRSKETSKEMKGLAKSAGAIGASFAAMGIAFKAFGQSQADVINDLNDMSTRSGIAAESIQALQFAFVASGQEASTVQGLLDKMPKIMGELARGTGSASVAAERLGFSVFDATGKLKSSQKVFEEITADLQDVESKTERATLAAEIFGRQAGNMLQAFGQTEGLKTFVEFTDKFGVDIEAGTIQAAQFQQGMAALDITMKRAAQSFGLLFGERGFLEPIKQMAKAFVFLTATVETVTTSVPSLIDFMFNRVDALIANFIGNLSESFLPLMQIFGLDDFAKQLEEARDNATATLKQLNKDMNLNLDTSAFERVEEFDKEFEALLKTLQREGTATQTVITETGEDLELLGELAEQAAKEAAKAWKEFGDVLDDFVDVDFAEPFEQIGDAMLLVAEEMEKHFDRIVDNIEKTAGLISAIASGDIVGGVQQFTGPIGGAIAGSVGAVSDLGQRIEEEGGTEFIKLDVENFVRGFVIGLSHLPAILIEVLPPLLFEAAGRIVIAIIQLPFHIAKAVKEAIKGLGDVFDERQKRREEEGLGANTKRNASRLAEALVSGVMMGGGSFIPKAANGMRFTGNRRGLAMLHEGEFVVPQSGRQSQAVMRQMGQSGGVNIVINADVVERNAIDELVRRIERRFDLFGTSTSPLFSQG